MNRTLRTYAIGVCIGTVAVAAALCLLPGAPAAFVISAYLSVHLLMALAGRYCPWSNSTTVIVLMAAVTLSTIGVILNVNFFTRGGTLAEPLLENFDMNLDWNNAVGMLRGHRVSDPALWRNYSYVIVAVCFVFGANIAVPMMFNVAFYGLSLIVMGKIAYLVTDDARVARLTVIVACCVMYLLAQSMTLLKDALLVLLMALIALKMVAFIRRGSVPSVRTCIAMLLLVVFTVFIRSAMGVLIALSAFIFLFACKSWPSRVGIGIVAVVAVASFLWLPLPESSTDVSAIINRPAEAQIVFDHANTRALDSMMENGEDAADLSLAKRILWLPASVLVQFLVPFPWNFTFHANYGPSMILSHVAYPWYIIGALILYWVGMRASRSPRRLLVLVTAGIVLYVAVAFATTGRISRYCLPLLPLLLPAAAVVLAEDLNKKSLRLWLLIYAGLMIPGLIVCHYLQAQFMS